MKNSGHARQLWESIEHNNLAARHPHLGQWQFLVEQGLLSDELARDLLLQIEPLVQEAIDHPHHLHRPPDLEELYPNGPPDIEVGALIDNPDVRFGLRLRDRPRSVLVTGNAGAGKTTAILNIVARAEEFSRRDAAQQLSIIILDKKLDYAHLADQAGSKWVRLSVHDDGTRIGLGAPAGMLPNVWINLVAMLFSARARMIASWTSLANMMRWLVLSLNPDAAEPLRWPSLGLLLEVAQAAPASLFDSKPDYAQTRIQNLQAITQATQAFDCFGGLDLERDIIRAGRNLILEMPNVAPSWVRQFMIDMLLAQLIYGRIHRRHKMDRTQVIVCLDEADQDATLEADRAYADAMPPLAMLLRQGREYGLMAVAGLSRLTHASPSVLVEPQYHLMFNQSDAASIHAARQTLVLPPQADLMFPGLQPGECIVREAQGPWPHPMLVKIDPAPLGRGTSQLPYDTHPITPATSLAELPEVQEALRQLMSAKRSKQLKKDQAEKSELHRNAHALLHTAALHPMTPVARLWEKAGQVPSPEAQIAARRALERRSLAEFEEVRIGRANVLLIRVTKDGFTFLGRADDHIPGRGGIAHQHIAAWIAAVGRKRGYEVAIEWTVPGTNHPVDDAWRIDGAWHAFEIIVTCSDNLASHIHACFVESNAVATLTIIFTQKGIRDRVRKKLLADPGVAAFADRLQFEVVETYMKEFWP